MGDLALRVEHLSKRYMIGAARHDHTLRPRLAHRFRTVWRRSARRSATAHSAGDGPVNTIWALRDVSFEVHHGEVLGIIGRNGAGKTTVLKILSRITEPTAGRAEIYGRVSSLLEVGTGFHAELTGRENIYLNGAILGMTRAEIVRKFDEIVAFAEVDKFIDTPLKRYSSGMYVRLAFAVAAHLEPDILVVDEVLAVGDAQFQEKCMGAMRRSASQGRTVLFVSHNMASIQHLSSRAILLASGRIVAEGRPQDVVISYLSEARQASQVSVRDWRDRVTNGQARIVQFEVADGRGQLTSTIPVGGAMRVSIAAEFYDPLVDPCFGVLVDTLAGDPILDIRSIHSGLRLRRAKGHVTVHAAIENLGLYPGEYLLSPWIADSTNVDIDWVKHCRVLRVVPAPGPHGDLRLNPAFGRYWVPSMWRAGE